MSVQIQANMTFNANATQAQVTSTIQSLGMAVTVSRAGANLFKTNAVFDTQKKYTEQTGQGALSSLIVGDIIAYIPGNVKSPPQPEDNMVGTNRTYNILTVEQYAPAGIVIAYKLELN